MAAIDYAKEVVNNPEVVSKLDPEALKQLAAALYEKERALNEKDAIFKKRDMEEVEKAIVNAQTMRNTALESISDPQKLPEELEKHKKIVNRKFDSCIEEARRTGNVDALNQDIEVLGLGFVHSNTLKLAAESNKAIIDDLKQKLETNSAKRDIASTLNPSFANESKKQKVETQTSIDKSQANYEATRYPALEKSFAGNAGLTSARQMPLGMRLIPDKSVSFTNRREFNPNQRT